MFAWFSSGMKYWLRKDRDMSQLMKEEIIKDIMTNNYLNTGSLTTNLRGFYFSFSLYFASHLIKKNFHDTFNFYKPDSFKDFVTVDTKLP